MPPLHDAQYEQLMNQIRANRRRFRDNGAQAESARVQRKNAVGLDNVRAADHRYQELTNNTDIDAEYDRLVSQVISIYGQGGHNWPS